MLRDVFPRSVITSAVLLVCGSISGALAADWHVNPDGTGDVATIQAAFDAASPGDRIVLAPGIYQDTNTRPVLGYLWEPNAATAVARLSSWW